VHFGWKIWRNSHLNRVAPNGFGAGPRARAARATSHSVTSAPPPYVAVHACRGQPAYSGLCVALPSPYARHPRVHGQATRRLHTGHTATPAALTRKECLNRLKPAIKAPAFFTRVNTEPAAVRHRCRLGELPASCVHDAIGLRLTPLPTHLEPTRAQVALAEPPARRSTSSHGRRQAAAGEPHSPLELQVNQPFQDLH
jgi:hypothetical protein